MAAMEFIHTREYLSAGDTVVVKLSHKCYVRLLDDDNFQKYRNGFTYQASGGGYYEKSPVNIKVPAAGFWVIAIDMGGKTAQGIKYSVTFLKAKGL